MATPTFAHDLQDAVSRRSLVIACAPTNDLWVLLSGMGATDAVRCATAAEAIEAAADGAGVLILAEGYPAALTELNGDLRERAQAKRLRIYCEYPAAGDTWAEVAPVQEQHVRGVVTSDFFGPGLPPLRLLGVGGARVVSLPAGKVHLGLARVVGVDEAIFGLNQTPVSPLLSEYPDERLLLAATKLSQFATARWMPAAAWSSVWGAILRWAQPAVEWPELTWVSAVRPSFSASEPLPSTGETEALRQVADWVIASRVLRHRDWPAELQDRSLRFNTVLDRPADDLPVGDGSWGVLEGFSSSIRADGSQPMRYAVRSDCSCETAMLMGFDAAVNGRTAHGVIAGNLLDYSLVDSDMAVGSQRANPESPSYGLIAWALDKPDTHWADDNARAVIGALAVAGLQNDGRWSEAISRCLLANLRLTGVAGHRHRCLLDEELEANGWRHYWRDPHVENTAHMQAWLPACYFWAFAQTGFAPFRDRGAAALRTLMTAGPERWECVNGSGSLELARLLLPLAWLVRIADTAEHRGWLERVATELISLQDESGAICEIIRSGKGAYANCIAKTNAEFGTCETSLIDRDGAPICDLLYTCNYAAIGLNEAYAVTADPAHRQAEDRLVGFLCRVQTRSEAHPELSGAWYRAFNFRDWDFWASSSDGDWGPWCLETGWTQPWIAATLGLRRLKKSLWEVVQSVPMPENFDAMRQQMLPDEDLV